MRNKDHNATTNSVPSNKILLVNGYQIYQQNPENLNTLFKNIQAKSKVLPNRKFCFGYSDQISYFKNDDFGIKSFFINLVSDIDKDEINRILEELKKFSNKKENFSVSQKICLPLKFRDDINKEFKFEFFETIYQLENNLHVFFLGLIRFLTKIKQHSLHSLSYKNNKEILDKFLLTYKKYFTSSFTEEFFQEKDRNFIIVNEVYLYDNLKMLLEEFNEFKNIFLIHFNDFFVFTFKHYFQPTNDFFYSHNDSLTYKKLKIWVKEIFDNETNSILLVIFPELKIIFLKIIPTEHIRNLYKRIHFLVSVIVFKFHFLLPFLEEEIKLYKSIVSFDIINLKKFHYFILEIRLLLTFFAYVFDFAQKEKKIFFFRAFLSYVRIKNGKMLKYFLVEEFMEIDIFYKIEESIDFVSKEKTCLNYQKRIKRDILNYSKIKNFSLKLFNHTNGKIGKNRRLTILFNLIKGENGLEIFRKNNTEKTTKITEIFSQLLSN